MEDIIKKLYAMGIIPVVKIDDPNTALPIAKALCDGGLPCIEVTFRTKYASDAIKRISKEYPNMLVAAGTVLTREQADLAMASGAAFVVSPGFNPKLVKYCVDNKIPIIPGCSCPSDVEKAIELGFDTVKFFPAEASGGLNMIKALSGPFPNIQFMPTGGISEKNITEYLAFKKILACGGSFMVTDELVAQGNYTEITAICKRAVRLVLGLKIMHMGINAQDEEEHRSIAHDISKLTFSDINTGNTSSFIGEFEVMKTPYLGAHGHIALGVHDIHRAIAYYEMQGFAFNTETAKYAGDTLVAIYFEKEIAGFAYHLVAKKL